jgi:phosphatidylcholine synthase
MRPTTRFARPFSWGVHLLTASGAVTGLFALICIATEQPAAAALLMLVSLAIDSVDGTLARAIRVSEHLPQIDGRRLDDMIDYLNFVVVPVFFLWGQDALVHAAWLAVPVLASAYGFSRVDAKTDDDFFLGFPSYWNVLALYLWLLDIGRVGGTLWVTGLSLAVFVPIKYIYPSKVKPRSLLLGLWGGAIVWMLAIAAAVIADDLQTRERVAQLSLAYPVWYLWLSFTRGGFAERRIR